LLKKEELGNVMYDEKRNRSKILENNGVRLHKFTKY